MTSFRSWLLAAPRSSRRPSSPSPWKLYGELRGLKAPPRRIFAPARLTAAAVASTCSSVSAEHGPAITMTSSPPIRTSPIVDDGVLRLERAAGQLVRLGDAQHLVDAVQQLDQPRVDLAAADHAEHRARGAGRAVHVHAHLHEVGDDRARSARSVARSFITTTMTSALSPARRLAALHRRSRLQPLEPPRLVDDPLEQPRDGIGGRAGLRGCVDRLHVRQHDLLSRSGW